MPWFFDFRCKDIFPRHGSSKEMCSREGDGKKTWKVCDCIEGGDQISRKTM